VQNQFSLLRSGGVAARSQQGVLFLCSSTWGYTSLAVARWIHPRLPAAAAPQLRRLLNITSLSRTRSLSWQPFAGTRCGLRFVDTSIPKMLEGSKESLLSASELPERRRDSVANVRILGLQFAGPAEDHECFLVLLELDQQQAEHLVRIGVERV
jgi:hypothetical protein